MFTSYPRDNISSLSPSTATTTSLGDALNTPLSTQMETGIQTHVGDDADSQVTSLQGGKIVLWPTQSYIAEAYNQLGNQLHNLFMCLWVARQIFYKVIQPKNS